MDLLDCDSHKISDSVQESVWSVSATISTLEVVTTEWGIQNIFLIYGKNQFLSQESRMDFSRLWSPEYWLPSGNTWNDVPVKYTDLIWPILLALPILAIRVAFERFIASALDWSQNTESRSIIATVLRALTTLPAIKPAPSKNLRRKKILENMWRLFAYILIVTYGLTSLSERSWFYDMKECWMDYPKHAVDTKLWWYYMLQTAFYYALIFSCAFDVRRNDFIAVCIHHAITIGLLSFSWVTNFVRVGTLVLLLHDISDVILEFAKYLRLSGRSVKVVNVGFVAFLMSWIATRVIYFPFVLMRSAIIDAPAFIEPGYSLFLHPTQQPIGPRLMIFLLFALFGLHLFWTVLIMKVVCRTIVNGKAEDVRSDDEEELCDEKENDRKSQKKVDQTIYECKENKEEVDKVNNCQKIYMGAKYQNNAFKTVKVLKTRRMLNELRKRG